MPVTTRRQARLQQERLQDLKHQIDDCWQEAQQSGEEGYSKFMDLINEEKRQLDREYNEAKSKGAEISSDLKDRANIVVDKLDEITHGFMDADQSGLEKGWTESFEESAEHLWANVKDYASAAGEKVHEAYEEAKDFLLSE